MNSPEQKLAIAVIEQALVDAWAKLTHDFTAEDRTEARRFLLFRTDRLTKLWFTLAGLDMKKCRDHWIKHGLTRKRRVTDDHIESV